jgi:hypothetical protein
MDPQPSPSSVRTVVSVALGVGVGVSLSRVLERELGVIPGFLLACCVAAAIAVIGGWIAGKLVGQ